MARCPERSHPSALIALLSLTLSVTARADMPRCLRAEARGMISCGPLHAGEPVHTPRLQHDPWKGFARSGQSNMRYLTFSGLDARGEPLFRRSDVGEARTAEEWLRSGAGVYFFDSGEDGELTPPITIHVRVEGGKGFIVQGLAYFNARELRIVGSRGGGVTTTVRHACEPFFDLGIDLDHDGVICDERGPGACCPDSPSSPEERTRCNEYVSATNSRWDVELDAGCDPSVVACDSDGPRADGPWPPDRAEWAAFVRMHEERQDAGQDPRMLAALAHEPFLEWAGAPPRERAAPRLWSFARERSPSRRRGVGAPLPWGSATAGYDRTEADVVVPLVLQGVVYNEGRVVLGDGFTASGSVLAGGGLVVEGGATIAWSSDFSRPRFPPPEWKGVPDYCK